MAGRPGPGVVMTPAERLVAELVASAPPLSPEKRARLGGLLRPPAEPVRSAQTDAPRSGDDSGGTYAGRGTGHERSHLGLTDRGWSA